MRQNARIALLVTAWISVSVSEGFAIESLDHFDGTSINESNWTSVTPYPDSGIDVQNGLATLSNHGELISRNSFTTPYEITGRFQFAGNSYDSFNIAIRTSGAHTDTRFYDDGFMLTVAKQTDDFWRTDLIRITKNNAIVIDATYPFVVNQFYDFKITDSGVGMEFYFGDLSTALVSVTDSDSFGGKVGIYNREGTGGGSSISNGSQVQLDFIEIRSAISVPEVIALSDQLLMLSMAVGALAVFRRATRYINHEGYDHGHPTG